TNNHLNPFQPEYDTIPPDRRLISKSNVRNWRHSRRNRFTVCSEQRIEGYHFHCVKKSLVLP
ncbi:MAG: hypothetical protein MK299_09425, partial [Pseudomonadales bacterium]|nr:hypothetical protein [Pseudomonadales bacterium]